jgi:hypothetical protein
MKCENMINNLHFFKQELRRFKIMIVIEPFFYYDHIVFCLKILESRNSNILLNRTKLMLYVYLIGAYVTSNRVVINIKNTVEGINI